MCVCVLFAFSHKRCYAFRRQVYLRMFRRGPRCIGRLRVLFSVRESDSFFSMDSPQLRMCAWVCRLEYVSYTDRSVVVIVLLSVRVVWPLKQVTFVIKYVNYSSVPYNRLLAVVYWLIYNRYQCVVDNFVVIIIILLLLLCRLKYTCMWWSKLMTELKADRWFTLHSSNA